MVGSFHQVTTCQLYGVNIYFIIIYLTIGFMSDNTYIYIHIYIYIYILYNCIILYWDYVLYTRGGGRCTLNLLVCRIVSLLCYLRFGLNVQLIAGALLWIPVRS